ncbi:response regulator transcription factor [bacterium M00.F.Ca.ET.228.01.1.1]|uniref:response regulator transcription factor n=1 Tax=Paraburkholderia phenoliruptrix TaxID=252970 RepID=UPI0010926211|nr:response regulator transcription factor [Paraburkholderia phenoliruptrix]TGP46320.1 response regulator transcription factor [bacterium M00.F.Ca.ET.228.01.1.1]TGS03766.1 response regulator transcription factor [bacterium M00.F.Ca.ET.191.01.1.1]TGU07614.1 response regulator transcription factor [bacterium M00.F.Ca.ET.155.01.1.1]MBW0446263.1 response regulator transcription factor [Paraburkholderia phenoliruptrix]MBW9096686.1 response regulator transcription factor [Paraburkholderia phenolirup
MKLAVMTRSATLFGLICRCFEADGAVCHRFADDVAFARAIYRDEYSAILIDADTGLNPLRPVLARRACYADRRAPLIVIGAGHDREAIGRLFDAGADDVVLSPVDAREVMLRVHLALLRAQLQSADSSDMLECGVYRLDRRTCTVHVDSHAVRLTPREFAIAWLLFSRRGEYVSRRQIAGAVWSRSEDIIGRTLEQHIYKLRKKLELNGPWGVHLRTLYAHGYRIEMTDTADAALDESTQSMQTMESLDSPASVESTAFASLHGESRAAAAVVCIGSMPRASVPASPPRAEVHPADSAVARNAPAWGDSQAAFAASAGGVPKTPYALLSAAALAARTRGNG